MRHVHITHTPFANYSHPLSSVYPTSEPHPAMRKISRSGQDLQRKRIDAKLMPWQPVAVKPCNCGLLYAKVETADGPSKRAPSKATCNNLEPWSLAKRHTTSSVTTQAKCEGVKVSLRQHKGSEMTYLPGCSLRNLPSNPLNTNLNFEMPSCVQWAGCGWQIIATKKHGFFHPKATSTVSCVPSNRCNRNFICMGFLVQAVNIQ